MLVGRDGVFQIAARAVAHDRSVVVVGEPGSGKTAFLNELARSSGRAAFAGGGLATLADAPFFALCRALRLQVPPDRDHALDVIERTVSDGVLLVDDLQWADTATLELLPHLVPAITVVAAIRTGDPQESRARRTAAAMGAETIELGPLADAAAAQLVSDAAPHLPSLEVAQIVRAAGGNPLMLLSATRGHQPPARLHDVFAVRLAALSPAGQRLATLLALLGRPLARSLAGDAADELVKVEVAVETRGRLALVNSAVGDIAATSVPDDVRQELHLHVARLVCDDTEAARHLEAAGDRPAARAAAMAGAQRAVTVETRATCLELAARCSDSDDADADAVRLAAARALLAAGRPTEARDIATQVRASDGNTRAEAAWLRARAARHLGDPLLARQLLLEAALGAEPRLASTVLLATTGLKAWPFWDADCWEAAQEASAAASPSHHAWAEAVVAAAAVVAGRDDWNDHAVAALGAAGSDAAARRAAYAALAAGHFAHGRRVDAARILEEAGDHGRALQLLSLALAVHGEATADDAVRQARRYVAAGADDADVAAAHLAVAMSDLGHTGEALAVIADARARCLSPTGAAAIAWAEAEAELAAGRPRRALAAARGGMEPAGFPLVALTAVAAGWAAFELGESIDPPPAACMAPAAAGSAVELGALQVLADGRAAEAAAIFDVAAVEWQPVSARAALRCRWAGADAAGQAGDHARATDALKEVEAAAAAAGNRPLVARARASLRATGVRTPPRSGPRDGDLSGREREVLTLVADGLTTGEIATRAGRARSTVETQIESAVRKLGARNRRHAATLLTGGDG